MRSTILSCLVLIAILLAGITTASAGTVTLEWGAVSGADGYHVYTDNAKGPAVTGTTSTVTVPAGEHSFYVTAFNGWGESAPSNTVKTPPLPGAPADARVIVFINIVQ